MIKFVTFLDPKAIIRKPTIKGPKTPTTITKSLKAGEQSYNNR
jgi:hypothetical protein